MIKITVFAYNFTCKNNNNKNNMIHTNPISEGSSHEYIVGAKQSKQVKKKETMIRMRLRSKSDKETSKIPEDLRFYSQTTEIVEKQQ